LNKTQIHSTLNPQELLISNTIDNLYKNKNIIIKPADKNLGIVILPILEYQKLCLNVLSDHTTYSKINDNDNFNDIAINKLISILKQHDYLYIQNNNNNSNNTNKQTFNNTDILNNNINDNNYTYLAKSLLQLITNNKYKTAGKFYGLPKMHKPI
jgi:hypothetical protein